MPEATDRAVRGPRAPRTVTDYRRARDVIKTYGEEGAAERLGVSRRTLRAWANPNRARRTTPSRANRARLAAEHDTPEVRRATAPKRRMDRFRRNGMRVAFTGIAGPRAEGKDYVRLRTITTNLPPDAAAAIMDAYLEGGGEAAQAAFREAMREHYHEADWIFREPSEFRFDDPEEQWW
jgi:riboflavin biosynthesis pyrimidine reductase